jgi:hypothetical protein
VESFPPRRRKLSTIKKNCPRCPVYNGELSLRGELAAEIHGQLSTKRELSTIMLVLARDWPGLAQGFWIGVTFQDLPFQCSTISRTAPRGLS